MLSACSSLPQAPLSASADEPNIVIYQCEQGIGEIEMHFYPTQEFSLLMLDGISHKLTEERAASGFWYTNGKYTFRGKGQTGWLEIGRRAPIDCRTFLTSINN